MKPVKLLKIYPAQVSVQELSEIIALVHSKLNELISAHNELLAKYESHKHVQTDPTFMGFDVVKTKELEHD